jgi:hypothetical protein
MSALVLSDAQEYLNTTAADAAKLQAVIDAAEAAIGARVGPLSATATTRRVRTDYWCRTIALPVLPAISLTSVTYVGGAALTLADLYLDTTNGLVSYTDGLTSFIPGWYEVVYQSGRATLPSDLMLAVKELVRHMWTTQRGSGASRPGTAPPETLSNTLPGSAYTFPMRIEQLLVRHQRFGFA